MHSVGGGLDLKKPEAQLTAAVTGMTNAMKSWAFVKGKWDEKTRLWLWLHHPTIEYWMIQ